MKIERHLMYNAMRTPDGTLLHSRSRHDYVSHVDANGETYINDGGLAYLHRSKNIVPAEDLCVYSDAPHEKLRGIFSWGTYGKNPDINDENFGCTFVHLSDLSDGHIKAIIKTQTLSPIAKRLFKKEVEYRDVNDIHIEEVEDYSHVVENYE